MANAGVGDHGELDAETSHYAHDQNADAELKDAQAFHVASWVVEDEDEHDIDDGESTSCYKWDLGRQEVEGNGGADDLCNVGCDNGNLSQSVHGVVQPSWEEGSAC